MAAYCTYCGDEFDPVEYRPAPVDPDEPAFCSADCEEDLATESELTEIYIQSRYGGAPVF